MKLRFPKKIETYRYAFNGMEKDDEVKGNNNHLDFGARAYDNRFGRFFSLDAYASEYPNLSDYSFVANSPLMYVDPDGNKIVPVNQKSREQLIATFRNIGLSGAIRFKRNGQAVINKSWLKLNKVKLENQTDKKIILESFKTVSKSKRIIYYKAVNEEQFHISVEYLLIKPSSKGVQTPDGNGGYFMQYDNEITLNEYSMKGKNSQLIHLPDGKNSALVIDNKKSDVNYDGPYRSVSNSKEATTIHLLLDQTQGKTIPNYNAASNLLKSEKRTGSDVGKEKDVQTSHRELNRKLLKPKKMKKSLL